LIKIYAKKEIKITASRDDYFRFGLVFIKKIIKSKFFKKNQNQVKPIWLGFLDFSSVFSGFGSVFRFGSGFFPGFFGLVSVRFFWFFAYETEPAGFFKILIGLIGFFYSLVFSVIFFPVFLI
jgi:hypothetical protein